MTEQGRATQAALMLCIQRCPHGCVPRAFGCRTPAGFPVRATPRDLPGYDTKVAQGIAGGDFECAGSILPGVCAFSSPLDAAAVCPWLPQCAAVTVYSNGERSPAAV